MYQLSSQLGQCRGSRRVETGKYRHTRIIIRYPNPTRSPLSLKDPTAQTQLPQSIVSLHEIHLHRSEDQRKGTYRWKVVILPNPAPTKRTSYSGICSFTISLLLLFLLWVSWVQLVCWRIKWGRGPHIYRGAILFSRGNLLSHGANAKADDCRYLTVSALASRLRGYVFCPSAQQRVWHKK